MGPEPGKRRVLVLDDDVDFCELVLQLLELRLDVECLVLHAYAELVARGAEVLACSRALLDVNLGRGEPNGIDAARWLRAHRFGGAIVFLTGHARDNPLLCDIDGVATRVLVKPVEPDTLVSAFAMLPVGESRFSGDGDGCNPSDGDG